MLDTYFLIAKKRRIRPIPKLDLCTYRIPSKLLEIIRLCVERQTKPCTSHSATVDLRLNLAVHSNTTCDLSTRMTRYTSHVHRPLSECLTTNCGGYRQKLRQSFPNRPRSLRWPCFVGYQCHRPSFIILLSLSLALFLSLSCAVPPSCEYQASIYGIRREEVPASAAAANTAPALRQCLRTDASIGIHYHGPSARFIGPTVADGSFYFPVLEWSV